MTAEAKRALSSTIRSLRSRLLDDLHAATESAYRLSVHEREAGLSEFARVRRRRLDGWIREQERAEETRGRAKRPKDEIRREPEKQAAYTLLNRLIFLRLLEAAQLRSPVVVTGGWESRGYRDFRELAPELVRGDETEGFEYLLRLVFEDLATELPGLFGSAGVADLIPIPAATLRHVLEALNDTALESCWTDDMTLGWVYQYWNDPEREALDAKLNSGGKLAPHEIASKTQMFTERYMVDWLLQNSLGPMWFAMCRKHGWTPEVESDGTLARLEERRAEWRARREAGEVSLTELMPLRTDAERRWAYYLTQPIPDDAVEHAPRSVRALKIIDPAVGSGHFLVVLFDLLFALYQEESRHRGEGADERWSPKAIVENILENNLHGIDLDPRAVQIAAAALWLKAKLACGEAHPSRLNLVASNLRLASLPDDDPALVELRREIEREVGIPGDLTDTIIHALKGADHLGSLLKIDAAVDDAIRKHESVYGRASDPVQGRLFGTTPPSQQRLALDRDAARASVLERIEAFLVGHTTADDLGLRLRGEQLAAGVRFVRMLREGEYHLATGNPPYQGTSKLQDASYLQSNYNLGKADLYAAFLQRGLELVRPEGSVCLLTMRSWMFIYQYIGIRAWILANYDVRAIGDFAVGAFDEVANDLLSVAACVIRKTAPAEEPTVSLLPSPPSDRSYDRDRTQRKRAATLCQVGLHSVNSSQFARIPQTPMVHWWSEDFVDEYSCAPKVGEAFQARSGAQTSDDLRFLRLPWEVQDRNFRPPLTVLDLMRRRWVPYIPGAAGIKWIEAVVKVIRWENHGLEVKVFNQFLYGSHTRTVKNEDYYFKLGIGFATIGNQFSARLHRCPSIFGSKGASVFPSDRALALCNLNARKNASIVESLNPGMDFTSGDVNRIPVWSIRHASRILETLESAFSEHEMHREASIEFRNPGPSHWASAQEWAQIAVDQNGDNLPPYVPCLQGESGASHLSFALGVALGRFGLRGEGILDPSSDDLSHALHSGILFLDGALETDDLRDSLGHSGASRLHAVWEEHGRSIDEQSDLRDYLRTKLFEQIHRKMYESRPIHLPLSSEKKTFVAWVTIHRWNENTLRVLLADHLHPTLVRLDGELEDLRAARDGANKKEAREAEKQYAKFLKWREELAAFITNVESCAEQGPPPTDSTCPPREVNGRYAPDLNDGVMINSAALWPLLFPQWKEPKKWWKELAKAEGKKDYDWSHLAMRYWPTRVDAKCQEDPSLAVAHGCFWKYHPARAWAWELRLQDEIGPAFRIEEALYRGDGGHEAHRRAFLAEHPDEALQAIEKEALRRRRKKKQPQAELRIIEPGLWSAVPSACWAMELRVIEKQKSDFYLRAPDEADARAAYTVAHPELLSAREQLRKGLPTTGLLFKDGGDEGDSDEELEPNEMDGDEEFESEADEVNA